MFQGPLRIALAGCLAVSIGCVKSPAALPADPLPVHLHGAGEQNPSHLVVGDSQYLGSPAAGWADEYRIAPNDVIEIAVFDAPELSRSVRVSDRGEISLPLLGAITVAGLTPWELELIIADRLRQRYIRDPHVTVQITEIQTRPIYVLGEVNRPGSFPVDARQRLTVLQAVTLGHGLRHTAAQNRTRIIRTTAGGGRTEIPVDLRKVLNGSAEDVLLQPNDIVFVPNNTAKAFLHGALNVLLRIVTFRAVF